MRSDELLLRNTAFRRFFAARVCSFVGDGIAVVALVLLVEAEEGSGVAVGALLLASTLPRLLGPLAGAVADRVPARTVMVGCDLGQAAIYAVIALADPAFPVLIALVVAATLLVTLFGPANSAALPRIVAREDLLAANARFGTAFNLQLAAGPVLGGLLVAGAGTSAAIGFNALSFLASAAFLLGVPGLGDRLAAPEHGVLRSMREGLAYVAREPVVRAVCIAMSVGLAFAAMDNVALVFLARDELGAGPAGYGLLNTAWGVGMLLGGLLLLRGRTGTRVEALFLLGLVLTGAGILITAFAPTLAVAALLYLAGGVGNGLDNVTHATLIQNRVPQALLGRVFGVTSTAAYVGAGAAAAAGGPLLDATSPRTVFLVAGGGLLVVCALVARSVMTSGGQAGSVSP